VSAARRYVTLHPGSADAAYAQFLIGSAYYERIADVSRDQGQTEKAIAALEEVTAQVSGLRIRAERQRKRSEMARDQLAGKEMLNGRYELERKRYGRRDQPFQDRGDAVSDHAPRRRGAAAAHEAYMALGVVGEAQTAAAVLGHNFPDSRWYQDAYRLVKSGGFEPTENKGSWISRAFAKIPSPFAKKDGLKRRTAKAQSFAAEASRDLLRHPDLGGAMLACEHRRVFCAIGRRHACRNAADQGVVVGMGEIRDRQAARGLSGHRRRIADAVQVRDPIVVRPHRHQVADVE